VSLRNLTCELEYRRNERFIYARLSDIVKVAKSLLEYKNLIFYTDIRFKRDTYFKYKGELNVLIYVFFFISLEGFNNAGYL